MAGILVPWARGPQRKAVSLPPGRRSASAASRAGDRADMSAHVRHPLIENHDLGFLVVLDVRVAVDSHVSSCAGSVVGEELALSIHPVEPKLAVSLSVAFHATAQPEVLWRVDPDSVPETVRDGEAGAGNTLQNHQR